MGVHSVTSQTVEVETIIVKNTYFTRLGPGFQKGGSFKKYVIKIPSSQLFYRNSHENKVSANRGWGLNNSNEPVWTHACFIAKIIIHVYISVKILRNLTF